MIVLEFAGVAASCAIICGGLWSAAEKAEKVASKAAAKKLRSWLEGSAPSQTIDSLATVFAAAFDSIFGSRLFSIRCFVASYLASVIAVTIVVCFWVAIRPQWALAFLPNVFQSSYFFILLLTNLLPDYLSLVQSRWIIRAMGHRSGGANILGLLVADLFLTSLIAFLTPFVLIAIVEPVVIYGIFGPGLNVTDYFLYVIKPGLLLRPTDGLGKPTFGIFIYATYFTSVWVWLYIVSCILVRFQIVLATFSKKIKWALNLDKPFHVVAMISMVIVTTAHLAVGIFAIW